MARVVISEAFGPPEAYSLRDAPARSPGPKQVRVSLKAVGISYVDVLMAAGEYQVKPPLPFIPGSEAAGVVMEVGVEAKDRFAPGDGVVCSGWGGLFADEVVLPAEAVRPMPAGIGFPEAAVLPVSYQTAWHALVDRGQVRAGETVLVLGAGGATGYAAIQVARHLGARVIASASSEAKRALALAGGADAAVDARSGAWRDEVKNANAGKPVDVVFDPVGGDATDPAFRSLGWKGRHLIIGFPAGIATLRTNLPLLKGSSLVGVDIRQFGIFEPELSNANRVRVFELASQGVFRPPVARTYPLEEYATAMRDAAAGETAGRIVLAPSPT
jgi:NADPH2:quinone reductase